MVLAWQKLMFLLTYGMVHMMPHSNALDNFIAKKSASGVMCILSSPAAKEITMAPLEKLKVAV